MKNTGPFLAFNAEWFERWQTALIWLLWLPVIGLWMRWWLCIRKCDAGYAGSICRIEPHCYHVLNADGTITLDCRTHPKYAKRVYFAFRPIWWTLHYWDELFADRFAPGLSFGFGVLTVYPDPGSGATTADGDALRNVEPTPETFSTIRAGAGTTADVTHANVTARLSSSATTDLYKYLLRGFLSFFASGLTGEILSASVDLYLVNNAAALGTTYAAIAGATPASSNNLVAADFSNVARVNFGSLELNVTVLNVYNKFVLNSSGIATITLGSIVSFSLQLGWDLVNSFTGVWAASTDTVCTCNSADVLGTSTDPKLVMVIANSGPTRPNRLRPAIFKPGIAR